MELKKIKLKKLFAGLDVEIFGNKDLEISGLSAHSKRVSCGHLFIAKGGLLAHGADFIEEAILGGASAVLSDLYNPFLKQVTQVVCSDPSAIEGEIAKRFFDPSTKPMNLVGITGTNGKTTTAYLIRSLLGEQETGLIGTIEYLLGQRNYPATLTTPDVITNHKMLAQMREAGLKAAVMEVTSHGLVQKRVAGIDFDLAVFTNISRDHLDYHKTMENYVQAKSLLFSSLKPDKKAIINLDDSWHKKLTQECRAHLITYGINSVCDYQATHIKCTAQGTQFDLIHKGKEYKIDTLLVGLFNVYNALAALACAHELGIDLADLICKLKELKTPKGRLEPIANPLGFQIFVDFAHTPDALEKTLQTLKEVPHNRLITVFGCGGDRDQDKRPLMGKAVTSISDLAIITSDNPRTEDPQKICEEIRAGCALNSLFEIIVNRREAIEKAFELAGPGDLVLIAGRGHEPFQIIGRSRIPFSDAGVVKEILESLSES